MSRSGSPKDGQRKDPITQAVILDHNYDGIEELDNPLPKWWLLTFYGAIVFAFGYVGYYWVGTGPSLEDELQTELDQIELIKLQNAEKETLKPEVVAKAIKDPRLLAKGKTIYMEKCAACHRADGGGSIGPNLADRYWIHGGSPVEIAQLVQKGVAEKGMPPWKALLSEQDLLGVVGYVISLKGTNPENAKPPQGEELKN